MAAPEEATSNGSKETWWLAQARWLLFSVGVGALAIVGTILWSLVANKPDPLGPALGHGQLLIAATGLSGSSLNRIVRKSMSDWSVVLVGVAFLHALIGTLLFGVINLGPGGDAGRVVTLSMIWWTAGILVGIPCVEISRK